MYPDNKKNSLAILFVDVKNYINGEFVDSITKHKKDIFSPLTGNKIGTVTLSNQDDLESLVKKIKSAQLDWAKLTFKKRAEIIYRYRDILIAKTNELANVIHMENGKSIADAQAEIAKAIETVEYACTIPNIIQGGFEEVSNNVYCFSEYRPLGIVSSIVPFNFPTMVPHWTIAHAIVLGNAMILKPSEQTPIASQLIANYFAEAGLPKGIFNILNGEQLAVEALCDHKDVKAISFVGSTKVAKLVYQRASQQGKRVIALGGAKNHIIVTPDVEIESTTRDLIASAYGMVGQRCMAASVIISVGNFNLEEKLVKTLQEMKLGPDLNLDQGLSPVTNLTIINNIKEYINYAKTQGANILVDGTTFKVSNKEYENGYYIGPTLIDWRGHEEKMGSEEVFGPLLELCHYETLEKALIMQNASPYGNAGSIFTRDGLSAFNTAKKLSAGMLGINIGVPVPREPFSFGGIKNSKFGHGDITGELANSFWADLIKITMKWNAKDKKDWMS